MIRAALFLTTALCLVAPAFAQQSPTPSNSPTIAIAPTANTAASTAGLVIKAAPGNLYSLYATSFSTSSGFVGVTNTTTVPGTGSVTGTSVIECVALPANGTVVLNFSPSPPHRYSTGISAFVTSAANCFTYTNTISAFISGSAP